MKRRRFIATGGVTVSGITLMPALLKECSGPGDPLHEFGLITNVVQENISKDPKGTLTQIAEMGYKYLEFGGTWGEDPALLLAFMKEIGLIPLAGGTDLASLQGDGLNKAIDDALMMEKSYLVCYWPWMDGGEHPAWDQVQFAVDQFQRIGEACNRQGLRFAFHNHEKEFREIDGRVIYDHILDQTDPDLVTMEVDLYWAYKGGADIRKYFTGYPGRFELVHVKDSYDSPELRSFACVGSGIIDFPDLFSYRDVAGFRHLIVEHDQPGRDKELACARSSIEYLKALDF